jgi:hypothetical protein
MARMGSERVRRSPTALVGVLAFLAALLLPLAMTARADAVVYWSEPYADSIGRANLDGTGAYPNFINGADYAQGIAVDSDHIYWAADTYPTGTIGRASLDGTGVDPSFITGLDSPYAVAVPGRSDSP